MKHVLPILVIIAVCFCGPEAWSAPADKRTQELIDDAVADFEAEHYDVAIKKLDEANGLAPKAPFILNLLGAAYTKKKDYPKAESYFKEALETDFAFFPARYNVGELYFLQKMYPQALSYFSNMLTDNPGNELLNFKIVLCLLLTNQAGEAKKLFASMPFPGSEPAWYYSKAAIAYTEGNKKEAANLTATSKVLFEAKDALYNETFRDLGWPH